MDLDLIGEGMVADLWWQKKMKRVTQFRVHSQLLSKEGRPLQGCIREENYRALQARNVLWTSGSMKLAINQWNT